MFRHRVLTAAGIFLLVVLSLTFYASVHHGAQKALTSEDYSSKYRQMLSTIYPSDRVPHSKTLGIASRIYVIGLKRRKDRRAAMEKLARAMGEHA